MILRCVRLKLFYIFLHFRGSRCGPLFLFLNGSPLARDKLNSTISSCLALCNLSGDFTCHSFRIGAATTAAHVGISNLLFLHMVTRPSARLHSPVLGSKDTNFTLTYWKAFITMRWFLIVKVP